MPDPYGPYNDTIDYEENKADYYADAIARAIQGNPYFASDAFMPTKEYIPTPTLDWLRGQELAYQQGHHTLDSMIAFGLTNTSSPTSVLVELQKEYNADPKGFLARGIVPTYEETDPIKAKVASQNGEAALLPDWDYVKAQIDSTWKNYQTEMASVVSPDGSIKQDDNGYYTEVPSEQAQKFKDMGLPLPTDNYDIGEGEVTPYTHRLAFNQEVLDPMSERTAMNQMWMNGLQQRLDAGPTAGSGLPPGGGPSSGLPYSGQDVGDSAKMLGAMNPAAFPYLAGYLSYDKLGGRQAVDALGNVPLPSTITGPASAAANISGGSLLDAAGNIPFPSQISQALMGAKSAIGGLGSDGGGPRVVGARPLTDLEKDEVARTGTKASGPMPLTGRAGERQEITDLIGNLLRQGQQSARGQQSMFNKEQSNALTQFVTDRASTFNDDYFSEMGRRLAQRDRGQTPLTDIFGAMGETGGLPSSWQPTTEMVGGKAYQKTDRANPNFKKNARQAYWELMGWNT